MQIGPQCAEARGRGLIAQHKARGSAQLREKTGFAARTGADVQHGFAGLRSQGQGRQHGRAILNIDIPEKGGRRGAQGPGLMAEPAAEGRKGLGFEIVAFGPEQGLDRWDALRVADQTERAGKGCGHGAL